MLSKRILLVLLVDFLIYSGVDGQLGMEVSDKYFVPSYQIGINCSSQNSVDDGKYSLKVEYSKSESITAIIKYFTNSQKCMISINNTGNECGMCRCDQNGKWVKLWFNVPDKYNGSMIQVVCTAATNYDPISTITTLTKAQPPIDVNLTTYFISVNESQSTGPINCTAECVPICTYNWSGPATLQNVSVLEFTNVTKDNNGTYICTATNRFGREKQQFELYVNYGPTIIDLQPKNLSYIIEEGSTLGPVLCSSSCNPDCDIRWTKPGTTYTTSNTLMITNVSNNDSGTFLCVASNVIKQIQSSILITVEYGPKLMLLTPNKILFEVFKDGELGPINCSSECLPMCSYMWVGPQTNISMGQLQLNSIQQNMNGTYTCTAWNEFGSMQVNVDIIVKYGPDKITLTPDKKTYIFREYDKIEEIQCSAVCFPACNYTWKGPGLEMIGSLRVDKIRRNQTGTFSCEAVNEVGSANTTIHVTVYYETSLTLMTIEDIGGGFIQENSTINFTCEATGLPKPDVYWKYTSYNGTTKQISSNGSYFVQQALCTDLGYYTCMATNGLYPIVNRTQYVNITCLPKLIKECSSETLSAVKRNQTVAISACLQSNPKPSITWEKTEGNVSSDVTMQINITDTLTYLSTVETTLSTSKEVTLIISATNDFGDLRPFAFRVVIEDKPFQPKNVTVNCGAINRIQWISNFDGGRTQIFDIQISENNGTPFLTGVDITNDGYNKDHGYLFKELKPSTFYRFWVVAKNAINQTESEAVFCTTSELHKYPGSNLAIVVGGTVAGLSCIALFVVIIFFYRRHYTTKASTKTGLIEGETGSDDEDKEGLKDNPLYVSNVQTPEYNQVSKVKGNERITKSATGHSTTGGCKPIEMDSVYENADKIGNKYNAPVYGNVDQANNAEGEKSYLPMKNRHGLIYAELAFSPSNSRFVIHGKENKSIYADIDLSQTADPILDSDNEENTIDTID